MIKFYSKHMNQKFNEAIEFSIVIFKLHTVKSLTLYSPIYITIMHESLSNESHLKKENLSKKKTKGTTYSGRMTNSYACCIQFFSSLYYILLG